MMQELRHFDPPLTSQSLVWVLVAQDSARTVQIGEGVEADMGEAEEAAKHMMEYASGVTKWDPRMAIAIHRALRHLPRRVLLDMATWHWLTSTVFRDYTLFRWCKGVKPSADMELTDQQKGRFLGTATLNGVSRNALARLFWGAEVLHSESDGYDLVENVFANQDFATGLLERLFCLHPPASRACARNLVGLSEDPRREALRRLNYSASTITVEALTEEDVGQFLERIVHSALS